MSEKIEETLKRLAKNTPAADTPSSSRAEAAAPSGQPGLGDPDCPHCAGSGYLRRELPIDHPQFGRLEICGCRQGELAGRVRDQLYRLSALDQLENFTFENFNPSGRIGIGDQERESIERAFNHARMFAEKPEGWLMLMGGYGVGKTHLAAAVANRAVDRGTPTLFLTVPDLLDSLRSSFKEEGSGFEQRFTEIRASPLLVLDDFGTQNATDWAREKLFQILNHRYLNRLPTVITTNLIFGELDGRMRSRLADPELVTRVQITAPDYRRPQSESGPYELSSLGLHREQTFGTFSLREADDLNSEDRRRMRKAFEAARTFAEKPHGWLVFTGPYGVGKTHLAAAIANYRASEGHPVMFVVVPDLLDHLRATFSPNSSASYDRRFEELRGAPLLILDDLGTQAATPWVREKLYQLFNYRYNARLPTVITTADPLEDVDPRLRARMLDLRLCTIHAITTPAYRGGRS